MTKHERKAGNQLGDKVSKYKESRSSKRRVLLVTPPLPTRYRLGPFLFVASAQLLVSRATSLLSGVTSRLISIFDWNFASLRPPPCATARPGLPGRKIFFCLFTNYQAHFHPCVFRNFISPNFYSVRYVRKRMYVDATKRWMQHEWPLYPLCCFRNEISRIWKVRESLSIVRWIVVKNWNCYYYSQINRNNLPVVKSRLSTWLP